MTLHKDVKTELSNDDYQAAIAFNKANAAARKNAWEETLVEAEKALKYNPSLTLASLLKARAYYHLQQFEKALDIYKAILKTEPDNFTAALEAGNNARQLGDLEGSLSFYKKSISIRPDDARGYIALALMLEPVNPENAAFYYHHALMRVKNDGPIAISKFHHSIGVARLKRNAIPSALEALRSALREFETTADVSDLEAEILIDFAYGLLCLGMEAAGSSALERASGAKNMNTLVRVANTAHQFNFSNEAVAVMHRAVSLYPENSQVTFTTIDILIKCWKLDAAIKLVNEAEEKFPKQINTILAMRARIARVLGDSDQAIHAYERLLKNGQHAFRASLAMSSLYSDTRDPEEITALHKELFYDWGQEDSGFLSGPYCQTSKTEKICIGFVTADLHRQHPVNIFMQPMLKNWDQTRHPLTVYYTNSTQDIQTRLAKSRVTRWHNLTTQEIPKQLQKDGVNLLIDLSGHTSNNMMRILAKRIAPVQVTFLGYPGTTGVPNIDWIIGDPIVTPEGEDHLCSERVFRMPNTVFCYAPEEDYPLPNFRNSLCNRPPTFGSFNNIPKLSPRTIDLWARILREAPEANLLLKAPSFSNSSAMNRVQNLFKEKSIAPNRLSFRGPTGLADMMQEYADIDIALDPVPYNGGTTTLQAMWMGVPVVTLAGGRFSSRMGASFMHAAGLEDWVAKDEEEYVKIAVNKAKDTQRLFTLKSNMRSLLSKQPAWDIGRYTYDFQNALDYIWEQNRDTC